MTTRGRWMVLCALVGLLLGLIRGQNELSLLSLSVLVWLAVEWAAFQWRLWIELPRLRIERSVNGSSESKGLLWSGRLVSVDIRVTQSHASHSRSPKAGDSSSNSILFPSSIRPNLVIRDVVPENVEVVSHGGLLGESPGNQLELRSPSRSVEFQYLARVRSAGVFELPGVRLTIADAQGFFIAERFIGLRQTFRALPAYAEAGDPHPLMKRSNAIPQHGIHRVQRSGMGSELLELREYVTGDPPKSIAWKASARRGKLMTRQYEQEAPVKVQLFLNGSYTTRIGGFGKRLIDQMMYVAASVARSAISVGDPVGLTLLNEDGIKRIPHLAGERGFHKLLDALTEFSADPQPPLMPLSDPLVRAAMRLASERYPELLDVRVNQVPFTIFPILPGNRRRFRERCLLAGVFSELYGFDTVEQIHMIQDDMFMAKQLLRFLNAQGIAWMPPLVPTPSRKSLQTPGQSQPLAEAIVKGVLRARDNEVFIIFSDVTECVRGLPHLMPSVKMALGRHHRIGFVCPSPTFRRPTQASIEFSAETAEELTAVAEQLRVRDRSVYLQRELRRTGATLALSGEKEAIRMILSEMQLARSGRTGGMRR